jgi:DNA-directed RNA polymerase alpha subunit
MWMIFNNNLLNPKDKLRITNPYFSKKDNVWHIFVEEIKHEKAFLIDGETFENKDMAFLRFEELVTMLLTGNQKSNYVNPLLNKRIIDLDLTPRSTNCLLAEKIITVKDLIDWKEEELRKIPNLGQKSLKEIKDSLKLLGLTLKK